MSEILDTFVADTPFEAQLKAKEKYGDNFELINCKDIQRKSHFGFIQKKLVEITVRVNTNQPFKKPAISPYLEDVSTLMEAQQPYNPRTVPVSPIEIKKTYKSAQIPLRTSVDGLHDIQEGDDEPHSNKQPFVDDYEASRNQLLNGIKNLKQGREREKAISGDFKLNTFTSKKLEALQKQIDDLQLAITNFANSSSNFLSENQLPQGLSDLEKELQEIETPPEIINDLFKVLKLNCDKDILSESKASFCALHDLIKKRLLISSEFEIKKGSSPQVIVLMGPTGVGKTTTLAKLAAGFCFNPLKPIKACFFNIDFYKLGAKDQLQKYADIFRIPLEDITSIASLDWFLNKHKDDDLIIVDTAGRSQYAKKDLDELKLFLNRIPNATKYLTLSSTSKYSDLKEIVNRFSNIEFDHLILTKTDETKTIGPAVGLLLKSNKSLAYITHGQSVPEDYKPADFKFFEERLFHPMKNPNNQDLLF